MRVRISLLLLLPLAFLSFKECLISSPKNEEAPPGAHCRDGILPVSQDISAPQDVFNRSSLNKGSFTIDQPLENITAAMVENAYTLPRLANDKGKVCYDSENEPSIWTAKKAGLRAGPWERTAKYNGDLLRNHIIPNPMCIGLLLDQQYCIDVTSHRPPTNKTCGNRKPEAYKAKAIPLERDFTIEGVTGKDGEKGGFITNTVLFYTQHSLNLINAHITTNLGGQYYTFYVDCTNGVDQVQAIDCIFDSKTAIGGRTIYLYFKNIPMLDDSQRLIPDNCLKHLYVKGNTHEGNHMVSSDIARFTSTARFTGNTFLNIRGGTAISLTILNEIGKTEPPKDDDGKVTSHTSHAGAMACASCPVWIVGNTFEGASRKRPDGTREPYVYYQHDNWSKSYGAVSTETGQVYMIGNTIRHFISARSTCTRTDASGKVTNVDCMPGTQDAYLSAICLYYVKNTVTNVLRIHPARKTTIGICKGKGVVVPYAWRREGHDHADPVRYYTHNQYLLDKAAAARMWKERTYPASVSYPAKYTLDWTEGKEKDEQINLDDMLTIQVCPGDNCFNSDPAKGLSLEDKWAPAKKNAPYKTFTFSHNLIDFRGGNIGGMSESSNIYTENFVCEKNTFIADRISSDTMSGGKAVTLFSSRAWDGGSDKEYVFVVSLFNTYAWKGKKGKEQFLNNTSWCIKDNTFRTSKKNAKIRFVLAKYSTTYNPVEAGEVNNKWVLPATMQVSGNTTNNGCVLKWEQLNVAGWKHSILKIEN